MVRSVQLASDLHGEVTPSFKKNNQTKKEKQQQKKQKKKQV